MRTMLLLAVFAAQASFAGEADVVDVKLRRGASGPYDFDVTVRSVDKGWDYYADAFEVLGPDGAVLGRRILYHPHETEQPFTRELHGVTIPAGGPPPAPPAPAPPDGRGGRGHGG